MQIEFKFKEFKQEDLLEKGDVGRLYSSVVRQVDRQSKDVCSNPSAVESVFISTERFQIL